MALDFTAVDWGPVAGQLMRIGAPILGGLIGGPVGTVVGTVVSSIAATLDVPPTPSAIQQKLDTDPTAAAKVQDLEVSQRDRWMELQAQVAQATIEQSNLSLRAEITAGDRFQRWARPFNMYCVGMVTLCYGLCCVAAAINTIVTKDPTALTHLVSLGGALTGVLIPAGAVAGVTAWTQSKEKLAGVIQRPPPPALVPGKTTKR